MGSYVLWGIIEHKLYFMGFLVKNLPAMQETWVQFLLWEDPLEKEMATHSSILATLSAARSAPTQPLDQNLSAS